MAIDMDSLIVTTLERINEKMDKQDDKLDSLQEAIKQLIAIDIEIREIKEGFKRMWKEIDNIKRTQQSGGCATLRSFQTVHDTELKHNIEKIKECEDFRVNITKKVETLEKRPTEKMDKVFMVVAILIVTSVVTIILKKIGLE